MTKIPDQVRNDDNMPIYTFTLGHTPSLSLAELQSFFPSQKLELKGEDKVEVELESDKQAQDLIHILGGTVEISRLQDNEELRITRYCWKEWLARDRNKPYSDHKKGMLTPKVARIMVNLALRGVNPKSQIPNSKQNSNFKFQKSNLSDLVLYDPFCGSGTILMEAALLGLPVIGSDLDQAAVIGTKRNLRWLEAAKKLNFQLQVFKQDAAHVSNTEIGQKVDLIVTEPFLGKPRPELTELKNIFKGLEKLYLGVFKNWTKILSDRAIICIIFPKVETSRHTHDLSRLIDRLEGLGYHTLSEPIAYSRPDAIVRREIYIFRYQNH